MPKICQSEPARSLASLATSAIILLQDDFAVDTEYRESES